MNIERFYLSCLSHASYAIVSDSQAAIIDPQRDVQIYLDYLADRDLRLLYVIETHLHADFVSGHLELASRTGAEIVMGKEAKAGFQHRSVSDGDELQVGTITLKVLETPGHTPEGITIAATDAASPEEPGALFTGDTLFAGDVGRPDLLGAVGFDKEDLAGWLFDSLHEKVLPYPDDTRIYPAHGAGSSCGKALRSVEFTTIGEEKLSNYALQPMTRGEFIATITEGQPEAPAYFLEDAQINRQGASHLSEAIGRARALSTDELATMLQRDDMVLLDTRDPDAFSAGFIPGSVNIGLDGQFATWVGTLLPMGKPIVIVAAEGREQESVLRCARVGYDSVIGYLDGGAGVWKQEGRAMESYRRIEPTALAELMAGGNPPLLIDVRKADEHAVSAIPGSTHITLSGLELRADELAGSGRPIVVHCAGGYRSAMAVSLLKKHGAKDVADLRGGIAAWEMRRT